MFDARQEAVEAAGFAERCAEDRHHFRFIVSPDDADQLADLRAFTRDLMAQAERDLGTGLDWVAVDHWNTAHAHIHVLVRGRADDGADLVISRDYIAQGLRDRAGQLVTRELGPRSDLEIERGLVLEAEAARWTRLDRQLQAAADPEGVIDLRPRRDVRSDPLDRFRLARLQTLTRMGLAEPAGAGRWRLQVGADRTLRELGEQGDIIARLHRALRGERAAGDLDPNGDLRKGPIVGRLVARGLDDELKASGYLIVDGLDGRLHHVKVPSLDQATDMPLGGVVEVRARADGRRNQTLMIVQSDLDLTAQVGADGATWLDRQLVARTPGQLAEAGFGAEVRDAMRSRVARLAHRGLATVGDAGARIAPGLLAQLREGELASAAAALSAETGLNYRVLQEGEGVSGVYTRRLDLASGRFAMIDDGLGFTLAPWRGDLEMHRDQSVTGRVGPGGRMDWTLGRTRGPGR